MENTIENLYEETIGSLDSELSVKPSGVKVVLKFFGDKSYFSEAHYLLHKQVRIRGEWIMDTHEVVSMYESRHPDMIRKAIADLDDLKKTYLSEAGKQS